MAHNIVSIVLAASLFTIALSIDVWVNQDSASPGNGSSSDSPLLNLDDGLAFAVQLAQSPLQTNETYREITVNIIPSSNNYTVQHAYNFSTNASSVINLTIQSSPASYAAAKENSYSCLYLPNITFGPSTYFEVSSLLAFNLRGLRFYTLYDNTTFMGFLFDTRYTPTVVLSLVCIEEPNIYFQQAGVSVFLLQNSNCALDDVFMSKGADITTFNGTNISLTFQSGTYMWMDGGFFTKSGFMYLVGDDARSNNISISNFSLFAQSFEATNGIQMISSIYLQNYNIVSLTSISIMMANLTLNDSMIIVQDINTAQIIDPYLYNLSIVSIVGYSLFQVKNIGGFSLSSLIANAVLSYTYSGLQGQWPTSVYIVSVSGINTAGIYPNPTISNVAVTNSDIEYVTFVFLEGDYDYVNISAVSMSQNYFMGYFLQVSKKSPYDNMNPSQLQAAQNWVFENITLIQNNFIDFVFFNLSYETVLDAPPLLIAELDRIQLLRLQIINCSITKDVDGFYINNVPWISNVGYLLNITDMTLWNNTFLYYDFIRTAFMISSTLIRNSNVINNTINASNLLQENFQQNLVEGNVYGTFCSNNGSIYTLYRVSMIYNSTFNSNILWDDSYFFDMNNPFVFVLNSTFSNCNLGNSSLIRAGGFQPIPLDDVYFTYYQRNVSWENFIYGGDQVVLNQIKTSIFKADQLAEQVTFQISILGNIFLNCYLKFKSFIVIDVFEAPNSAVGILNNQFNSLYLSGFYVETMISVVSVNRLSFKSNLLFNFSGDGYAIHVLNFAQNKFLNLTANTITSCNSPGYLKVTAPLSKFLILTQNEFTNSTFNSTVFLLTLQGNENQVNFSSNSITNVSVGSNARISVPIQFFYLKTPIDEPADTVDFSNNVFNSVGFLKKDPFITAVDRNTLIVLSTGRLDVHLHNNFFNSTQVMYDDNYLAIAASNIDINNCTFSNIYTYESIGAVLLLGLNIVIQNSVFVNCSATDQVSGGAIYIDNDGFVIDPINITFYKNIFVNNSAGKGGLLYMRDSEANITFEKNYFFNNFAFNGSAIEFENVTFSNLNITESEVILALDGGQKASFLLLSDSNGVVILEDLFFRLGEQQSGSLFEFSRSPNISISMDDAEVFELGSRQDLITRGTTNYTLLLENVLLLLDADLLSMQTPYQNVVSITTDRMLQATIQPNFGNDPQTNLNIMLSYFSTASIQELGFMEIDSGNLSLKDLRIYALNLQSQPLFSINCYSNVSLSLDSSYFDQLGFYVNDTVAGEPLIRSGIFDISSQVPSDANISTDCQHSITVTNSQFTSLFSNKNATVLNNRSPVTCTFNFTSNLFQNLKASQGGAINSISSNLATLIYLRNNTFLNNQAFQYGGCIYNRDNTLDIQNCTFANNIAVLSGGAIYSETINDIAILNNTNTFINNSYEVQNGPDIASNPIYILVEFDPNSLIISGVVVSNNYIGSNCTLSNVTSYSFTQIIMYLKLYDILNQSVYYNSSSITTRFTFTNGADVKTYTSSNFTKNMTGYGTIPTVQLQGEAGTTYNVRVDYISDDLSLTTFMTVDLRDCIPGEINQSSPNKCVLCGPGTYSFYPNDTQCKICPLGAQCPGGTTLDLLKGRWREDATSDTILECFDSNDINSRCLGGSDTTTQCAIGYTGPLCSQCTYLVISDNKEVIYAPMSEGSACGKCPSELYTHLILILSFTASMLFEIVACYVAWTNATAFLNGLTNLQRKTTLQEYFVSLMNYSQIIYIVSAFSFQSTSFLNAFQKIDSPFAYIAQYFQNAFFYPVDAIATPVTEVSFIMECTLLYWNADPSRLVNYNIIILLASPVVKWLIMFVVQVFLWKFKLTPERKNKIIIDGLILLLIEQPGIVYELFAYFNCIVVDPGQGDQKYMSRSLNNLCYTDAYNSFLYICIIPSIILCIVVIPAIGLLILSRNRSSLNSQNMRLRMGCLYNAFESNSYYWWVVIVEFKILLLVAGNIFADLKSKYMILFAVVFIYNLLLEKVKPYHDNQILMCDKYGIRAYILTLTLGLMLINNQSDWIEIIMVLIASVFNTYVFFFIMFKMGNFGKNTLQKLCERLQEFLKRFKRNRSPKIQDEELQIRPSEQSQSVRSDNSGNTADWNIGNNLTNMAERVQEESANDMETDLYEGFIRFPNIKNLKSTKIHEVEFVENQEQEPSKADPN